MIDGISDIASSMTTIEAIEKIVNMVCLILNCQRATVFIYDKKTNELWSKVGKGVEGVIRIPKDKGIAGFVATNNQVVNIKNAYNDKRFDSTNDMASGFKTKTILAAPIYHEEKGLLGVIQAINKNDIQEDEESFFTFEDEGILKKISRIVKNILTNSLAHDDKELFYQDLRKILHVIL